MRELIGLSIEGDFSCCPNAEPYAFKCSNCGHIMAYCIESNNLFPDLNNLEKIEVVNSTDPTRPAFHCPRCNHTFEYYFLSNEAYRVTREEMIEHEFGHLLPDS